MRRSGTGSGARPGGGFFTVAGEQSVGKRRRVRRRHAVDFVPLAAELQIYFRSRRRFSSGEDCSPGEVQPKARFISILHLLQRTGGSSE